MKFMIRFFLALSLSLPVAAGAYNIPVTAKAAIIVNADNGEVLWAKNPHLKLQPASTTKVLTGIVALEYASMSQVCSVSERAAGTQASRINLRPGDELPVKDLIYALLLKSANDSAVVLAENIGGSIKQFAAMMNAKARAIGAFDSNFVNPHGLTARGQYTTAYDLALMLRYAIQKPAFKEVALTREYMLDMDNRRPVRIKNHNRLLWKEEGAGAGKTGYTRAARHCYVGEVTKDGAHLIVAILGSRTPWQDVELLIERGADVYATHATGATNDIRAGRDTQKKGKAS
ncbi:MAG: D-alanyl-D-alanine carboxypeptidase [Nitrospirota bacterium]|nr:D-alanyl-D-alanine carboxypeptidase [Nitrospirota bacterium]